MKARIRIISLSVLSIALIFLVGCTATAKHKKETAFVTIQAVLSKTDEKPKPSMTSTTIRPDSYKLALTRFDLIREDGTKVTLLETKKPAVLEFVEGRPSKPVPIVETKEIPLGTYTGYELTLTYLEMEVPCSFCVPAWASRTKDKLESKADADGTFSNPLTYHTVPIRLYFNDDGIYRKRDIVVNLAKKGEKEAWYFMRRELESHKTEFTNFLLAKRPVSMDASYPSGPEQVVSLFDDPLFWKGPDPIVISSQSRVGGMDARMEPCTVSEATTLVLTMSIGGALNFTEPEGFANGKLDFGPHCRVVPPEPQPITTYQLGDIGFHPFMPICTLKSLQ